MKEKMLLKALKNSVFHHIGHLKDKCITVLFTHV